jgi:hypothetical protein
MQTCAGLTTQNSLQRIAPTHTIDFACEAAEGFTGYQMQLSCGNALTGETIYT